MINFIHNLSYRNKGRGALPLHTHHSLNLPGACSEEKGASSSPPHCTPCPQWPTCSPFWRRARSCALPLKQIACCSWFFGGAERSVKTCGQALTSKPSFSNCRTNRASLLWHMSRPCCSLLWALLAFLLRLSDMSASETHTPAQRASSASLCATHRE